MSEIFDIVNEEGRPTGETMERTQVHTVGARHRTAHIWIIRQKADGADVLLQKRAMNKDSFPGCFDTSSAGHVQAGDEPKESALRELEEELGIQAEADELTFVDTFRIQYKSAFHGKPFQDNEIAFVFVYEKPVETSQLTIQREELDEVRWFDMEETLTECRAHNPKFCVPIGGLELVKKYLEDKRNR